MSQSTGPDSSTRITRADARASARGRTDLRSRLAHAAWTPFAARRARPPARHPQRRPTISPHPTPGITPTTTQTGTRHSRRTCPVPQTCPAAIGTPARNTRALTRPRRRPYHGAPAHAHVTAHPGRRSSAGRAATFRLRNDVARSAATQQPRAPCVLESRRSAQPVTASGYAKGLGRAIGPTESRGCSPG